MHIEDNFGLEVWGGLPFIQLRNSLGMRIAKQNLSLKPGQTFVPRITASVKEIEKIFGKLHSEYETEVAKSHIYISAMINIILQGPGSLSEKREAIGRFLTSAKAVAP